MAPSSAVPSRTAINALRGILLTTSCSVILLAEERRQRLKIARAAYENAKKLHTARTNRDSILLSESFGRRESLAPAESGDAPTTTNPQNPIRRRRRDEEPSKTQLTADAGESPAVSHSSTSPVSEETNSAEGSRKNHPGPSDFSPFFRNEHLLRIFRDDAPIAPRLVSQIHEKQNLAAKTEPSSEPTPPSAEPSEASVSPSDIPDLTPEVPQNALASLDLQPITPLQAAFVGEEFNNEKLIKLDGLIAELEASEIDQGLLAERLDSAIQLLKSMIPSQTFESQSLFEKGITILKSVIRSQEHSKLPAILNVLHPICDEILLVAIPAMDSLNEQRDVEGTRQLIKHLFSSPEWAPPKTDFTIRNPWVTRMLASYWRKTRRFDEIKDIYGLLEEAGLFDGGVIPILTQYAIRRRVALIALDAGDDATAKTEMAQLSRLRPKTAEHDVKLRGAFIVREASLGQWQTVWPQLQSLRTIQEKIKRKSKAATKPKDHYQRVLLWLMEIYCKDHTPAQIDLFIRDLISTYGMTLNQSLAVIVLDRHGRNRDLQSLVKWLGFCSSNGLVMNQIFFNEVVSKCCKYWSMVRTDVIKMLRGVEGFRLHDPRVTKYSVHGGVSGIHKTHPSEPPGADNFRKVLQLPETTGNSAAVFERTAFDCMNTWAQKKDWKQVNDTFTVVSEKGMGFSSRCLRLAVLANISLEGPHSQRASELAGKAHAQGHDVSRALVPLLMARLNAGDEPGGVLQAALDQESHIHDSVYNKAARMMTQKGKFRHAIRVCELAATHNGNGDLAYNQFNFANLVYAYSRERRYADLKTLVESFTSKSEWWQGSKECKETLKRSMKLVAHRAGLAPPTEWEEHEAALGCLNDAFEHLKALRATVREDRQILTQNVIGIFGNGKVQSHLSDPRGSDPIEDSMRNLKKTSEMPVSGSGDWQPSEEGVGRENLQSTEGETELLQEAPVGDAMSSNAPG